MLPHGGEYPYPALVNFLFCFASCKKLRAASLSPRPSVIVFYLLEFM
jgi:hypothetical protein